ncbi:MAG TPA: DUF3611 family protein [Elainellaceae cyanobacterium]
MSDQTVSTQPPSSQPPSPSSSNLSQSPPMPEIQRAASALRVAGWTSFWIQFAIALVSGVILVVALFSRNIEDDSQTPTTGFSLFLAVCGIIILLFTLVTSFRCTRFARQFRRRPPEEYPNKSAIVRVLVVGLIASLIGLFVSLLGAETGLGILLAKSFSQPQGAAVYTPDKIIRVLDILVPLINTNLIAAHFVSNVTSLWMIRQVRG